MKINYKIMATAYINDENAVTSTTSADIVPAYSGHWRHWRRRRRDRFEEIFFIIWRIKSDITTLQLSPNAEMLAAAHDLFRAKWLDTSDARYLNYFCAHWIVKLPVWYEGYEPGYIKEQATLRQRHNISRFLSIIDTEIISI